MEDSRDKGIRQRRLKMGQNPSKDSFLGNDAGFELLPQYEDDEEGDEEIIVVNGAETPEVTIRRPSSVQEIEEESALWITFQIFVPFLLAGMGMVGAGIVLDKVQHWEVFEAVSEIFILVPALLGLKGNLEMTLASRLSTQAHLGTMETKEGKMSLIVGNLALVQCQGIVVGFVASAFAVVIGMLSSSENQAIEEFYHGLLLCASSVVTASIASLVLGLVMVAVILASKRYKVNPDNVATPIAASLGDLITLALLSWIAQLLYQDLKSDKWLAPAIIVFYFFVIAISAYIAWKNRFTSEILMTGWTPVLLAMVISSLGGVILDYAVVKFKGIAVFQPVMNGVGGNLVAVQASRISTYLHTKSPLLGELPKKEGNGDETEEMCLNPLAVFFSKTNPHAKTARILLLIMIPGQLLFTYAISFLKAGHTSPTLVFLLAYIFAAVLQIFVLLHTAQWLIYWMWTKKIDPDNSAIPYLTALGDLLGTGLLAITFQFLYAIGDKDSDVGD